MNYRVVEKDDGQFYLQYGSNDEWTDSVRGPERKPDSLVLEAKRINYQTTSYKKPQVIRVIYP